MDATFQEYIKTLRSAEFFFREKEGVDNLPIFTVAVLSLIL